MAFGLRGIRGDLVALGLGQLPIEDDRRLAGESQQCEERDRKHEEQPRGTDITPAATREIFTA